MRTSIIEALVGVAVLRQHPVRRPDAPVFLLGISKAYDYVTTNTMICIKPYIEIIGSLQKTVLVVEGVAASRTIEIYRVILCTVLVTYAVYPL